MEWSLAHPLYDVEDIVELADTNYGPEADGVVGRSRQVFAKNVTIASTVQLFDKGKEFLAVCRGEVAHPNGMIVEERLLGFCWFDRGGYTTYSNDEICSAKFHHVDLTLPAKTRVRLINQMIDQHILWAHTWGIPVICSTSVRTDHDGFMRIHAKRGFKIHGSYAYARTEEAFKCLKM